MKMKIQYIFFVPLFILMCTSCRKYDQKLVITDVGTSQVIKLHKKPKQGGIVSMGIRGSGNLNGEAQIILPYKTEQINGKVSFNWGGDWYSDTMELRYQPINANSGILVIEYSFYDLK